MTAKHVPMRTCVECRKVRAKRQLVRVVRTPDGSVTIDERGKVSGRGAYLCRNRSCWDQALAHQRLEQALKTKLSAQEKQQLQEYGEQLPDHDQDDSGV